MSDENQQENPTAVATPDDAKVEESSPVDDQEKPAEVANPDEENQQDESAEKKQEENTLEDNPPEEEGSKTAQEEEEKPTEGEEDKPEENDEANEPASEKKIDEEDAAPKEGEKVEEQADDQPPDAEEEKPLPTSEEFAVGEAPEEVVKAGDDLSREQTPIPEAEVVDVSELRAESPVTEVIEHEPDDIIEEEVEVIPQFNRDELLEKYNAAIAEREALNQKNRVLQHKLAEYFRRKKTEENRQEVDRNVTDQEQRYMKYMSNLDELRQQEMVDRKTFNESIEESKLKRAEKQLLVEEECKKAADFKRSIAYTAINSRSGRPLTAKELEPYEQAEDKKETEVSQVRLENIKLRNRLRKRELQLKQKEELAEGLHLIDFEQLKIENQTYNEKIEERNEELMKLRKKITNTVQVLTHLKEKLQFVQAENQSSRHSLSHVEEEVAKKRDVLSRTKQARDALRHDNGKLQQSCGLLGNRMLLRDYEEGKDESTILRHKLDIMKRTHAELTLSLSGVKKKIEQARNNHS